VSGVQCSRHNVELYEDTHGGQPMRRLLCPEPGCQTVLSHDTLAAVRDQAWCQENGMTAPGWQTITPGGQGPAPGFG
jgi:hypothetical protein